MEKPKTKIRPSQGSSFQLRWGAAASLAQHTAMPQNAESPVCHENDTADACQLPLAMGYVPSQKFENLYSHTDGWRRGTIFKDLDKPYEGGCCR